MGHGPSRHRAGVRQQPRKRQHRQPPQRPARKPACRPRRPPARPRHPAAPRTAASLRGRAPGARRRGAAPPRRTARRRVRAPWPTSGPAPALPPPADQGRFQARARRPVDHPRAPGPQRHDDRQPRREQVPMYAVQDLGFDACARAGRVTRRPPPVAALAQQTGIGVERPVPRDAAHPEGRVPGGAIQLRAFRQARPSRRRSVLPASWSPPVIRSTAADGTARGLSRKGRSPGCRGAAGRSGRGRGPRAVHDFEALRKP